MEKPDPASPASESVSQQAARKQLLREIDQEIRLTASITGQEHLDPAVRRAIATVRRHHFVPGSEQSLAYANQPLPIGHRQTISQPFIVAIMTNLLRIRPDDTVLEVGTGSGYQAAVLSRIAKDVYSIEVIEALASSAAARLKRLGYHNVEVRTGDGARGWPEHAPYNGIIVTAAAPAVPPELVDQLAPGGRLVAPVGDGIGQDLILLEKSADGNITRRVILPVAFVPLTH